MKNMTNVDTDTLREKNFSTKNREIIFESYSDKGLLGEYAPDIILTSILPGIRSSSLTAQNINIIDFDSYKAEWQSAALRTARVADIPNIHNHSNEFFVLEIYSEYINNEYFSTDSVLNNVSGQPCIKAVPLVIISKHDWADLSTSGLTTDLVIAVEHSDYKLPLEAFMAELYKDADCMSEEDCNAIHIDPNFIALSDLDRFNSLCSTSVAYLSVKHRNSCNNFYDLNFDTMLDIVATMDIENV